jgi:threonyl-tRNA synthetase
LSESGLFADVDNGADTLPKKIRNGEIAQYNFIIGTSQQKRIHSFTVFYFRVSIVVGQEELDNRSVNVRNRDDVGTKAKTAMIPLDTIIEKLVKLKAGKSLQNSLPE